MNNHNRLPPSQVPQDPVASAHWLAVKAAEFAFLIPLDHSGEIFPWATPHLVPYTKAWFLGVVNLRGALCGVADLSKLMGSVSPPSGAEPTLTVDQCLIGFHASLEMNTVIAVDKLLGLRSLSDMNPKSSSATGLKEFVDGSGHVWQEIDMFALARDADFVNIAAIN